jgi:hypothetical protein
MKRGLLAILLSACGATVAPDAGSAPDAGGPRVELGTGTSAFVPIPESGAELELVAGSQGGFHVDLTARLWELEIDGLLVSYEAVPVGGTTPISVPTEVELNTSRVVPEGDHFLRAGDFLQLEVSGPADVVGMELEIRVRAACVGGGVAEDTTRARIVDRR